MIFAVAVVVVVLFAFSLSSSLGFAHFPLILHSWLNVFHSTVCAPLANCAHAPHHSAPTIDLLIIAAVFILQFFFFSSLILSLSYLTTLSLPSHSLSLAISLLSKTEWISNETHGHINMVCVCVCIYCFRYFG